MTPQEQEQDKIDDAIDFVDQTHNGITAKVNRQNTVIKAKSVDDIATFLNVELKTYVISTIHILIPREYPLLKYVVAGLNMLDSVDTPITYWYCQHNILYVEYDDFALGIAPVKPMS